MANRDEPRIFVGGLSWDTTERQLEDAFGRFGKILEAQVMLERDSGRPRGFGFVTFADRRAMEDAIVEMNNQDLNGRTITVNEAQPKPTDDPRGYDYNAGGRGGRSYTSSMRGPGGGGGGYHDRDRGRGPTAGGNLDCFKCGRPGHFARECPSGDGGGGGRFSARPRFGGGPGGRGDRFGGGGGSRYVDDRYDGGRYGDRDRDRDRFDGRSNGRDRYSSDRYAGDSYGDRYVGGPDRYPPANGFGKERGGYDRDVPRGGGDRYVSGGPTRYEGGGGYRERPGPYDRPTRVGRPSSYDR